MGHPAFISDGDDTGRDFDSEPSLPMPRWWKLLARAEYKRQLGTQARLAQRVGCSQANIAQALSDEQPSSKFVRAISEALSIPEPAFIVQGSEQAQLLARLLQAAETLSGADLETLEAHVALFEALARKSGK